MGTVLVVEDDVFTAQLFKVVVEQAQLHPEFAYTGQEAIQWMTIHGDETDVVILDMNLPVVNGPDVFTWLRSRTYPPRIIVSTADKTLANAYRGVADAVAFKPVGLSDMVELLKSVVRN